MLDVGSSGETALSVSLCTGMPSIPQSGVAAWAVLDDGEQQRGH